ATLRRAGNQVWLDGVDSRQYGNTVIGALTTTLRATGEDVDYDYLMGASGGAFRLKIAQPDWCPSSPFSFDRAGDAVKALGWTLTSLSPQQRRDAIVKSLEHGRPALFLKEEAGVILGFEEGGTRFLYRPFNFKGS